MKILFTILFFNFAFFAFAQPTNKIYWVGPTSGANLTDSYWAPTSGGAPGVYPHNTNYQLIFDGAGTASVTYTINLHPSTTTTGGFINVTSNTTVNLQSNTIFSQDRTYLTNSGLKIDAGSKLIFENIGTGSLTMNFALSPTPVYDGSIDGELVIKGPHFPYVSNCMNSNCSSETWFSLSNLLINSFTTRVITVNGIVKLDGTKVQIHKSSDALVFAANSTLILNTEVNNTHFIHDPSSTIIITGAGIGSWAYLKGKSVNSCCYTAEYGNIIYESPGQTTTRPLFTEGGWTVKGNLIIKNTGSGKLVLSNSSASSSTATIKGNLEIEGSAKVQLHNPVTSYSYKLSTNNLNIHAGGELDLTAGGTSTITGTLGLIGSFSNAGIIKASSTTALNNEIVFEGTTQQSSLDIGTISNDPISFRINNSEGILLNSNWSLPSNINSKLYLTNGNINMGSNVLIVQNPSPGAIVGGTAASHIIGRLRRITNSAGTPYVFPVDNAPNESANVKISPVGATTTTYEVSFTRPSPYPQYALPPGIIQIGNYHWEISRISGSENAHLSFVYGSNNFNKDFQSGASNMRVLHWNGSSWDNIGGTASNGEIVVNDVSTFSPFTLGTESTALPLRLVSFSCTRNNNINLLNWKVEEENSLYQFIIERSNDGRIFQQIGNVDAIRNSNNRVEYSYSDRDQYGSVIYYRLKVIELTGKINYSQILLIRNNNINSLEVYPNPAKSIIIIQSKIGFNTLFIYSANGKIEKILPINQTGIGFTSIDISDLAAGIYFIKIGNESVRFIKF